MNASDGNSQNMEIFRGFKKATTSLYRQFTGKGGGTFFATSKLIFYPYINN